MTYIYIIVIFFLDLIIIHFHNLDEKGFCIHATFMLWRVGITEN